MREGNTVSGAYLAVEPGNETELYAKLHDRPRVLGMVANAAAIQSFYATIGEFILFYNLVATVLAGAIGFGVVYNSARIASPSAAANSPACACWASPAARSPISCSENWRC